MDRKPLFLLSNDDGVSAPGLQALIGMLRPMASLFVVAPDKARSGAACAITSDVPVSQRLLHAEEGLTVYACSGMPADCVKLALDQLLQSGPDMVIGGINHGRNDSINANYSGTLGVVREGALHGIPSVAFSLSNHSLDADFSAMQPYVERIVALTLSEGLPYGTCLNVNFPDGGTYSGIRVCRMAYGRWIDEFSPCEHPRGGHYYWLGGEQVNDEPDDPDTDAWALEHGYVAITPTTVDVTDYRLKSQLEDWDF
ncbi:MAG: 5'/3'-nucleotidase SurE [Bacteroidaceae bacterium]|nr:5'/3'-nucleotidase SurE [Bacteroidaceae bacterium]